MNQKIKAFFIPEKYDRYNPVWFLVSTLVLLDTCGGYYPFGFYMLASLLIGWINSSINEILILTALVLFIWSIFSKRYSEIIAAIGVTLYVIVLFRFSSPLNPDGFECVTYIFTISSIPTFYISLLVYYFAFKKLLY